MKALFSNVNFKIHWVGGAIANVGNFFTYVALPWLVLSITDNNPIILTTVVASITLPQGLLLLFGGALVDKLTPIKTLIISRALFCFVMSALAVCVYVGFVPLWLIYVFALFLGTLGALGLPAGQSLLPLIVDAKELGYANGLVMGTSHIAQIVGPTFAGWVLWFGREISGIPEGVVDFSSIAFAFSIDAFAVFIALIAVLSLKNVPDQKVHKDVFKLLLQGLRFCWCDRGIRWVLSYLLLISFFVHGPLAAGLPYLAKVKLELAEAAFGTLYAMMGVGVVVGAGLAMILKIKSHRLGSVVLVCDLISGLCFSVLGSVPNVYYVSALLIIMGVCSGVVMIAGTTWFQMRTPGEFMGRIMGVLMFAIIGMTPISASISGVVIDFYSVETLMNFCGLALCVFASLGLLIPGIRMMGAIPPLSANLVSRI